MASYTPLPTKVAPELNLKEGDYEDYEKEASPMKSPPTLASSPAPSTASPETLAGQKFKIMLVVFSYFVISM
ncbi:hypothetical protein BASA81_000408 [Batrachochytrium salamandrivorans]|nr:hypothetical protein BASA81_000408 [Batrachochytrium salamandrivorans]